MPAIRVKPQSLKSAESMVSIGIAGRESCTEMPDGFKQKDDKWAKYTPEAGLYFGFNF